MTLFSVNNTVVVLALPEESQGLIEKLGFRVFYTGIGLISASARITEIILKENPTHVLNLGTAGSFKINPGQLVECDQFINRTPNLLSLLDKKISVEPVTPLLKVRCGSADTIENENNPNLQFEVMDMEAYALAQACASHKVKFTAIKYISDRSDQNTLKDWKLNLKSAAQAFAVGLKSSFQN